jgi:thioredoxin-like negative regulator of GroEL
VLFVYLEPRLKKVIDSYNQKVQGTSDDKQVTLAKIDIDEFEELSSKYNVQAVPTGTC